MKMYAIRKRGTQRFLCISNEPTYGYRDRYDRVPSVIKEISLFLPDPTSSFGYFYVTTDLDEARDLATKGRANYSELGDITVTESVIDISTLEVVEFTGEWTPV